MHGPGRAAGEREFGWASVLRVGDQNSRLQAKICRAPVLKNFPLSKQGLASDRHRPRIGPNRPETVECDPLVAIPAKTSAADAAALPRTGLDPARRRPNAPGSPAISLAGRRAAEGQPGAVRGVKFGRKPKLNHFQRQQAPYAWHMGKLRPMWRGPMASIARRSAG